VQPEPRRRTWNQRTRRLEFSEPIAERDPLRPPTNRGYWRPFQIAFLLSCVRSVADSETPDREAVELIWFPTGGGKTEAYLALTAFSLFHRRLTDASDTGVDVLMRYTLRLLTAQQFQRAASLICAMEHIRRTRTRELGHAGFSIGIWVGGGTTPNDRVEARRVLRELERGRGANQFLLTRCPWCSGQIGPIEYPRGNAPRNAPRVEGYVQVNDRVVLRCADSNCPFSESLPVCVVDEDIYEEQPSLVIGTVDKFAQLAWKPEARSMFGLEPDGSRSTSPPTLIIQDELHLISGPLGSMVGIYEAVIHELCTDRRAAAPRLPKIISSTATIRRYEDQIQALYARNKVYLFPSRGLDAGDSFFATYARNEDGELRPGRKYVGIHGGGLGSVQTAEVRTFAALLQAPTTFSAADRDPWWTLMIFFNSLRELGTSLTLFQSDIPDYLKVVRNRLGLEWRDVRKLWDFLELTGRLSHEEIPRSIARLEVPTTSPEHPVDACLASNIIEVGIDIERLSVMAVVGQPKTTAQYIQVTGRVGRKWWERPGLIATIYSPSKPRDRSHFEKFRSYHERLYAQVEPTSVTPFSPPVLERALHAVLVSYVRQAGGEDEARSPWPYPEAMIDAAKELLAKRAEIVDPEEAARLAETFDRRARQWRLRQLTEYRRNKDGGIPLLLQAGAYATATETRLSWQTPVSLRNVDAECQAQITQTYIHEAEAESDAGAQANDEASDA
jgi:Helicase conserved C-terminal domain